MAMFDANAADVSANSPTGPINPRMPQQPAAGGWRETSALAIAILRVAPLALSLCIAAPVEGAQDEVPKKSVARQTKAAPAAARKSAPNTGLASPAAATPTQSASPPAPVAVPPVTASFPAPASEPVRVQPVTGLPPVNPYLDGWFAPTDPDALPRLAVAKIGSDVKWVADSVTAIPGNIMGALPSIKKVHPTGGRELIVANFKCPAEAITGEYFTPTNVMREGLNGMLAKLNETGLLTFDIQLVCN